jgi:Dolichyl-phosphate-mannose-protein mannosyltransferase
MNKQFESRLAVALMFAIFALAVVFRFLWLETIPGLNGDEAWLGWKAARAASGAPLDWRTNSGNFTNPFFLLPLVWVHYFFEPSAWAIRIVAALSGVVTLVANFLLCRRIFNEAIAWATTLLMAVMPVAIAYSRFGWEPSQIPLFSIFIVYSALALGDTKRAFAPWVLFSGVSLFCGFLVHPTMAYLGLFPAIALAARWLRPEESIQRAGLLLFLGVCAAAALGGAMYLKAPSWVQPEIAARFEGWGWVADMPRFLVAWLRNFNGINMLGHLPGSCPGAEKVLDAKVAWPVFEFDIAIWLGFLCAVGLLVFCVSRDRKEEEAARMAARKIFVLLVAFLIGTFLFGIMNGTAKVAVWFDRYGFWALVPGCLVLGFGYAEACRQFPKAASFLRIGGFVVCAVLLGMCWNLYFAFFLKTGGEAPWLGTRVGERQGALDASEAIRVWELNHAPSSKPVLISSDWFAFWPIAYYMQRKHAADSWEMVYAGAEAPEQLRGKNRFSERFAGREVLIAEFDGADAWEKWREVFPDRSWDKNTLLLKDIAGRPNLRLDFPVSGDE